MQDTPINQSKSLPHTLALTLCTKSKRKRRALPRAEFRRIRAMRTTAPVDMNRRPPNNRLQHSQLSTTPNAKCYLVVCSVSVTCVLHVLTETQLYFQHRVFSMRSASASDLPFLFMLSDDDHCRLKMKLFRRRRCGGTALNVYRTEG